MSKFTIATNMLELVAYVSLTKGNVSKFVSKQATVGIRVDGIPRCLVSSTLLIRSKLITVLNILTKGMSSGEVIALSID